MTKKPFPFDTAPRSFRRQFDARTERILRNASDYTLFASSMVVAGVDAGLGGYPWAVAHRLGCDMAKTAESLAWAFARVAGIGGRPDRIAIPPENVDAALAVGLDVEIVPVEPQA